MEFFAERLAVDVEELATGKPAGLEARLEARLMDARIDLSAGLDQADEALSAITRDAKRFRLAPLEAKAEEARRPAARTSR